jgi:TPP-dependent pyruvate/acetoin dehydrogenase alpha subunit
MSKILKLYKEFLLIRLLEEQIIKRYEEGNMRCPTHLSIGQEAVAVAFSQIVNKKDFAISTHRAHAHYIAKGGNINYLVAELYGKKTGCSGGKGGSMHLIDLNVNFMGSSSILANNIPIGVGLGLAINIKKKDTISYIFLGDAATEQGVFYESLNFAVVKKIPAIFICENNRYSVYSKLDVRQPKKRKISQLAKSIGLKSYKSNGKNIFEILNKLSKAKNYVSSTRKPCFIEVDTYRWFEHCGIYNDDQLNYRPKDVLNNWKKNDNLILLEKKLIKENINTKNIKLDINKKIQKAFKFAESSSFPKNQDLVTGVYAK